MSIWEQVQAYFHYQFLSVELWRIALAIAVIIFAWALKKLFLSWVIKVLLHLTQKTKTEIDDMLVEALRPPLGGTVILVGFYVAALVIRFPTEPVNVRGLVMGVMRTVLIIMVAWGLYRCVRVVSKLLSTLTEKTESDLDDQLVPFVEKFLKVVAVIIAIVMVIREWGYDVTGLLAGLGLGGLAFALAARDTLANLFGSIMILTDRPFGMGDWIRTTHAEGTVEEIGFRSTKVRTFANSLVTIPNSLVASSNIENWSRMFKRRIYYKLGVTYSTSVSQMKETVERIKDILRNHPEIHQDFWMVNFTDFNDSSMDIMIYCFTKTTVWGEFLAVQEDINLKIMETIEEIGVEVAFPSRSVYMESPDPAEQNRLDQQAQALLAARQAEQQAATRSKERGSAGGEHD
jgi:MscS family membrane protein